MVLRTVFLPLPLLLPLPAAFLLLLPHPAGCDMPVCNRTDPDFSKSPYCLPDDYNKDIVPPTGGRPLHINVDIWVFEVRLLFLVGWVDGYGGARYTFLVSSLSSKADVV